MTTRTPNGSYPKCALVEQSDWVPADFDLVLVAGDPRIQVLLLPDTPDDGPVVGFAKGQPSTFEVTQTYHETVHILEGSARVTVGGETVDLGPGDATTFYAGHVARWTIVDPLVEFFVMSPAESNRRQ